MPVHEGKRTLGGTEDEKGALTPAGRDVHIGLPASQWVLQLPQLFLER